MRQTTLFDVPKQARACPTCNGPIKAGRCRPCAKDTPASGGPAWRRWTRGIREVVRARCDAAGFGQLACETWEALLFDTPAPPETAAHVADVARLPFSMKRYQRVVDRALLHSKVETMLVQAGYPNGQQGRWVASNVAMVAAERIMVQRERVAGGETFNRRHDAELVHEAVLEHEAREQLRVEGWRGARLAAEVNRLVEVAMRDVRGTWGRPSDEYPKAVRIAAPTVRVAVSVQGDPEEDAEAEAEASVDVVGNRRRL